jgi:hypothetical protein
MEPCPLNTCHTDTLIAVSQDIVTVVIFTHINIDANVTLGNSHQEIILNLKIRQTNACE